MDERSTHFQGFAGLLLEKLKPDLAMLFVALGSKRDHDIEAAERIITRVIAESAYDLEMFGCRAISEQQIKQGVRLHPNAMLRAIPDMTEWPADESERED